MLIYMEEKMDEHPTFLNFSIFWTSWEAWQKQLSYNIRWVWPPPSNSHHQDYYILSRGSRPKPSFATGILGGGHIQNIRVAIYAWYKVPRPAHLLNSRDRLWGGLIIGYIPERLKVDSCWAMKTQKKRNWLFRAYRRLYYPVKWGL